MLMLLLALLLQTPSSPVAPPATLTTTIRMSIVRAETPPLRDGEKPNPYGNFGPLLTQLLTPEGPVDIQYVIAGDQTPPA